MNDYLLFCNGEIAQFLDDKGQPASDYNSANAAMANGCVDLDSAHFLALLHAGHQFALRPNGPGRSEEFDLVHRQDKSPIRQDDGSWAFMIGKSLYVIRIAGTSVAGRN